MNFSSLIFIFFFLPLFLLCYYATSKKYKHLVLLSGSIIFYAYSGVYNLCILISLSLINYLLVFLFSTKFQHKWAFSLLAILNIAALLLFKYNTNLLFPLGISFYVFNNVSYILDVRKDFKKCEKNFFYFMTYSTCFCHVTMGPLIRYHEFKDCIKESKISFDDASSGFRRFLKGLLKKVLLADNLGLLYGLLVSDLHQSVLMLILTLIVFALQLYLDFSGYCDMAIGLGKMLGIKYPENFDHPYLALSISDFWRKWHITLSAFFKEYVYYPLGGNRVSKLKNIFNLLVVWFLTGMWHGNTWNFLLWGAYYGILIITEKYLLKNILTKLPKFLRHFYVLIIVLIGYVFFSVSSLEGIINFFKGFVTLPFINNSLIFYLKEYFALIIISIICCFKLSEKIKKIIDNSIIFKLLIMLGYIVLFVIAIAYILSGSYRPFLYNNF